MRAAPADDDALDHVAAAIAGLPCTAEDIDRILHVAFLAIGFDVGADAGPFAGDTEGERVTDAGMENLNFGCRERVCAPFRMQPGIEECLIGVDVADAGDHGLVKQEGFQQTLATPNDGGKGFGREFIGERFRTKAPQDFLRVLNKVNTAEFARIAEAQLLATVEFEDRMRVFIDRQGCVNHSEMTGHAQMDDQRLIPGEREDEELGAAADVTKGLAVNAMAQFGDVRAVDVARPGAAYAGDSTARRAAGAGRAPRFRLQVVPA